MASQPQSGHREESLSPRTDELFNGLSAVDYFDEVANTFRFSPTRGIASGSATPAHQDQAYLPPSLLASLATQEYGRNPFKELGFLDTLRDRVKLVKKHEKQLEGLEELRLDIGVPTAELRFKGPFTDVVTSYLKLTNRSERRVCFKVKTTAPKRYCVRPKNGLIEPKGQAQIAVMSQPFDVGNQAEKNKHKFMVQTMFAPDGDVNQDTLWKEVSPDSVMDSKFKCVFDVPKQDETVQQLATSTTSASSSQAPEAPNSASATSDVRKVNDENRRLREELTSIRQENMQLKEEGLKQRIRHGASSGTSGSAGTTADLLSKQKMASGQDSPQDVAQLMMNPNALLFIAGIILGKVIF